MDLTPTAWQLWIIAALVFGALEIKLSGFVTLWFAVGALVAALAASPGAGDQRSSSSSSRWCP